MVDRIDFYSRSFGSAQDDGSFPGQKQGDYSMVMHGVML